MHRVPFPSRTNIFTLVGVIAFIALTGLWYFLQGESRHEVERWQNKLDILADMGARQVSDWLDNQMNELGALADNASVQIYFLELTAHKDNSAAENEYLNNMLAFTAERLGFSPSSQAVAQKAQVNIQQLATGGIALVDMDGHVLSATRGMPPLEGDLLARVKALPKATPSLLDMTQTAKGDIQIGFVLPIYSIQSDHNASSQVGNIVAIRPVDEKLYALLKPRARTEKTLENILLRANGDSVQYLSPLLNEAAVMNQQTAGNPAQMAGAYALSQPGSFAILKDYRGKEVLFTSRAIANTPWVLMSKVDRLEAFAASNAWQHSILAAVVLALLMICATLIAIWHSASARRASDMSLEFQHLAADADARARLLSLVTDNQAEALYIIDGEFTLWFANRRASELMNAPADDLRGKSLSQTLGAATAAQLQSPCDKALKTGLMQTASMMRAEHGVLKNLWVRFIPLESIPIVGAEYGTPGVLIVEQDVTALMREREKRILVLNQLVGMLVSLIDRRDPHASQHSAYVAKLAQATAREMNLDAHMIETIDIAAKLLNIGKMDIPAELLVRSGSLSDTDRRTIRSSLKSSADLLSDIEFEGPVADTLRHAQEFVDGTGPLGLSGDQILISARIVAAANALVGMLSVRAYRDALSYAAATDQLLSLIDTQFDRKVVFAMMNYLSNHGGQDMLSTLMRQNQKLPLFAKNDATKS